MYFNFPCPHCGKKLKVQETAAGRKAGCPYCRASLVVPSPPAESEADDPLAALKDIGEKSTTSVAASRARAKPRREEAKRTHAKSGWAERTDVSLLKSGLIGLAISVVFYALLFVAWGAWSAVFSPSQDEDSQPAASTAGKDSGEAESAAADLPGTDSAGVAATAKSSAPKFLPGELFARRGSVPVALVFLFSWSLAILYLKSKKLKRQRASVLFDLLPAEVSQDITSQSVDKFTTHITELPVDPAESFLINRVMRGLEHFRVRNSNPEVAAMLASQSEIDANAVESSYTILNVFIWAIPILGFIGTVIGISAAVGGFSGSMEDAENISALKDSLNSVTGGLATAFDTTLIALVMSILVMFPSSSMQKAEEDMLNSVDEYCNENLLKRLNDGYGGVGGDRGGDGASSVAIGRAVDAAMARHHAELKTWTEKLRSIGATLTDEAVKGWGDINERLKERQEETVDQVENLEIVMGDFQYALQEMSKETGEVQERVAASMGESSQSLKGYYTALEQGLTSLNRVLEQLGERQVVIQAPERRRGWFFRRDNRK